MRYGALLHAGLKAILREQQHVIGLRRGDAKPRLRELGARYAAAAVLNRAAGVISSSFGKHESHGFAGATVVYHAVFTISENLIGRRFLGGLLAGIKLFQQQREFVHNKVYKFSVDGVPRADWLSRGVFAWADTFPFKNLPLSLSPPLPLLAVTRPPLCSAGAMGPEARGGRHHGRS